MKSIYCLLLVVISTAYMVEKLRFCQLVWSPPAGYEIRKNGDHYDVLNPNIGFLHVG